METFAINLVQSLLQIDKENKYLFVVTRSNNSCQEEFYPQFKIDLGYPNQFNSLDELVWAIFKTIHNYSHTRIHTILKIPPAEFSQRQLERSSLFLDRAS
ncbi:MAG TPA: IS3 family transposase [Defluviitaleaceae bacterium]|nr:IS3 family transposase [Defluviitaleaceae bacterium]